MKPEFKSLNKEQQDFLALFRVLDEPVSIFLAGSLSPILPGPFLELVSGSDVESCLIQPAKDVYCLSSHLSEAFLKSLDTINSKERISRIIRDIKEKNLVGYLNPKNVVQLLGASSQGLNAVTELNDFARASLVERNHQAAMEFFTQALIRLSEMRAGTDRDRTVVDTTLNLSNLHYALGKGQGNLSQFLLRAGEAAKRIGDRRSTCLLNLHIGRLLHVSGQHSEALAILSSGLEEVKHLGDEDIMAKSAVFFGIFYYIQGRFREAIPHFERSIQLYQSSSGGIVENPSAPIFLGYSAAYLGRFAEAVGSLDCSWRLALKREDLGLATMIRAVLGTILVAAGKEREAGVHLEGALEEAKKTKNVLAAYLAGGGIAVKHLLKGQIKTSFEIAGRTISEGIQSGFVRQYTSPWILEMIFEFHRKGFQIPGFGFKQEVSKIMKGANVHLKGAALRLLALMSYEDRQKNPKIAADLHASLEYLIQSGDPIQATKTRLAIARLDLDSGNKEEATNLVRTAWNCYTELGYPFFPEDLEHLLESKHPLKEKYEVRESFLKQTLEIVNLLSTSAESGETLLQLLRRVSHLTKAERGGLFWFHDQKSKIPDLKAAINLTNVQIKHADFKRSLDKIKRCATVSQPLISRDKVVYEKSTEKRITSALCLPVRIEEKVKGVLYFDNLYLDGCFDHPGVELLERIASHLSVCIARILEYGKLRGERNTLASEKSLRTELINREEILAQSNTMISVLQRADQVAESDSTVLILGESGVGKELLARRLHKLSGRSKGPYIVVDIAGIPENLMESELFGHEKGSFTGADKQKQGRLELAHRGTLFIDEIGEISKSIQVKLLRAVQEKTFVRVGGTRTLSSDFRLITATNRDLEEEVAAGQFREDLYYRLNVLPIVLPPLRERDEDVVLLARHFWNRYVKKYGREGIQLNGKDEKKLKAYHWPGNIRELKNVMERAVILSTTRNKEIMLPPKSRLRAGHPFSDAPTLDEVQRRYIRFVLDKTSGKISGQGGAVDILGIKRQTLYARMKKLGIN